jgi:N-acyl-D-aspartate/D-glutamate deacylase
MLVSGKGDTLLFIPIANYAEGNLEAVRAMLSHPDVTMGLGDGGAHYGVVCDSTFTTFALTHWARDRASGRLPLEEVVRLMSHDPARRAGLNDRGRLRLKAPHILRDLPGGGRRISQDAEGFVATFVSGAAIRRRDASTDATPGAVVRGRRLAPAQA